MQYTVPVGVTQLKIEAIGGGTKDTGSVADGTGGAEVTGTALVTPGETLTIGVASSGGVPTRYSGGWGMTYNGNNYSGGNVDEAGDQESSEPGGGATVVADSGSGSIIVVAGGGGGNGNVATDCDTPHKGGNGGEGGSWTGGNGNPFPGGGGRAGGTPAARDRRPTPLTTAPAAPAAAVSRAGSPVSMVPEQAAARDPLRLPGSLAPPSPLTTLRPTRATCRMARSSSARRADQQRSRRHATLPGRALPAACTGRRERPSRRQAPLFLAGHTKTRPDPADGLPPYPTSEPSRAVTLHRSARAMQRPRQRDRQQEPLRGHPPARRPATPGAAYRPG